MSNHGDFYNAYGSHATNVVLNGFLKSEPPILFRYFSRIHELAIMNMELRPQDFRSYPTEIRKLTLLNNFASDSEQTIDVFYPFASLESLHLQSNGAKFFLTFIPTLQTLNLVNEKIYDLNCPGLKSITLDRWGDIKFAILRGMRELQHLRIRQSVDWKDRKDVEALKLQSLDVYYQDIPEQENLIFRLNDDCLLRIMDFLEFRDNYSLHQTHLRWRFNPYTEQTVNAQRNQRMCLTINHRELSLVGVLPVNVDWDAVLSNSISTLRLERDFRISKTTNIRSWASLN